jgi:hypothetical protein
VSQSLTILIPTDMDQAIRLAKVMASAKMLPKHLQGDEGTCMMIIEQAMRWGMSPFAVAQCTSSIGGKLMFEGKLVAAAVESSGAIEGHFDYTFDGDGDDRRVTVSARRRGETNPRQMTIRIKDVRTSNEWWRRQPDQMLVYSGTRNWARRFTPAALLGIYSPEEFDTKTRQIVTEEGPVIEAVAEPTPAPRSYVQRPLSERPPAWDKDENQPPPVQTNGAMQRWLDKMIGQLNAVTSLAEATKLLASADVTAADERLKLSHPEIWAAFDAVRCAMVDKYWPMPEGMKE